MTGRKIIQELDYIQIKLEKKDKEKLERYLSKYGKAQNLFTYSALIRKLIRDLPER